MQKLWFRRKWYGWGWYPSSWEGWLALFVYVVFFVAGEWVFMDRVLHHEPSASFVALFLSYTAIITGALIWVSYKKGETPRWQWGKPEDATVEEMEARRFFVGRAVVLTVLAVVALLVGGFYWFNNYIYEQKQGPGPQDYKNAAYIINGKPITLIEGISEVDAAPDSASKIITRYFGNEAKGDLNSDGIPDLAFLLTQTSGGSGTFYYVVAALQREDGGYQGTNAVLLGDRIAPQTTEIKDGEIIINYAERRADEPMTAAPSVGVSKYLKIQDGSLVNSR